MIRSFDEIDTQTLERYRADPCAFIEECLVSPYDGQLYQLNDSERAFIRFMFQLDEDGRLRYPLLIYSAIKKSRKTELAGILTHTMLLLFGGKFAEAYILANDQQQAISRCFTACRRIAEATPLLQHETRITQDKIVFPATQASITAVASDYGSIAGGHPTISVFDEIWNYSSERAYRLWDECLPVPSRKISCRLVVSHAGFENEGHLLHELYKRGLALPQVGTDLRAGDGMLMFWGHTPICHWQDAKWLQQMQRELRPNQYLRMIENRFVTIESSFVDMAAWDRCVHDNLPRPFSDFSLPPLYVGVDASTKHDTTAIVAVAYDQSAQKVRLIFHRVFQPSPDEPLDFENTIEKTLAELQERFFLAKIVYDPFQMASVAQRLQRAGFALEEFPQSSGNLTAASQNLYELIQSGGLAVYPDVAMRLAISRAVAVETPRGWRISKQTQSHKIDVVVALAMACLAAVKARAEDFFDQSLKWVSGEPISAAPVDPAAAWQRQRLHAYLRRVTGQPFF